MVRETTVRATLKSRRVRLLLGAVAAVLIAGALVAPVVISGGGSGRPCSLTLSYLGRPYAVRSTAGTPVQDLSIGVGVTRGCGEKPQNVDVRSITGVRPARAVGLSGDPALWVRRGLCARISPSALLSCLSR